MVATSPLQLVNKRMNKIMRINKQWLIFTPSWRFPRAWLQSPRHYVPAGLSAQANPAGVATLREKSTAPHHFYE